MSNIGLAQAQISSAGGGVSPEDLAAALAGYVLVDGSRAMTGPLVIGHPAGGYGLTLNSLSGASLGLYSYSSGTLDYWIGTFGAHGLRLATSGSGGSIIIAPTGEVGIGLAPVASYAATLGLTKIAHSGAEVSLGGTGGNFFIQNLISGKDIIFYNSINSPSLTFKDNGSVGIGLGTANTQSKLDVADNIMVRVLSSNFAELDFGDVNGKYMQFRYDNGTGNLLAIRNPNTTNSLLSVWHYATGNFGISEPLPYSRLSISYGTGVTASLVARTAGIFNLDNAGGNTDLVFTIAHTGALTASIQHRHMTVDGYAYPIALNPLGGKVSIGTENPVQHFDLAGPSGSEDYPVPLATGAQTAGVVRFSVPTFDTYLDFGIADADPWGVWMQVHNSTNNNAFPLLLNPRGGNVGIGTIAPAVLLDMFSSVADAALSLATSASGGFSILNLLRSSDARGSVVKFGTYAGATDWYLGTLYNDGNQSLSFSIAPTYQLVDAKFNITATGLVGIGTIAQTELFQVAGGKIRIGTPSTGDVSPTLSFYSTGSEGQIYQNAGDLFLGHGGAVVDLLQLHISGPISTNCGFHVGGTSDPGDNNFLVDGTVKSVGAFACNNSTPQTPAASGGALNAYGAGANGLDTGSNMSSLYALVVAIRAALVANGIMS